MRPQAALAHPHPPSGDLSRHCSTMSGGRPAANNCTSGSAKRASCNVGHPIGSSALPVGSCPHRHSGPTLSIAFEDHACLRTAARYSHCHPELRGRAAWRGLPCSHVAIETTADGVWSGRTFTQKNSRGDSTQGRIAPACAHIQSRKSPRRDANADYFFLAAFFLAAFLGAAAFLVAAFLAMTQSPSQVGCQPNLPP